MNRNRVAVNSIPCRVRVESGVRNAPVKSFFSTSIRNDENGIQKIAKADWRVYV